MDSSLYFSKFMMLKQALRTGKTKIHILVGSPGLKVPESVTGTDVLRLNLSHRFEGIDLKLEADADIEATLSFDKQSFRCVIPWESICAIEPAAEQAPLINFPVTPEQVKAMAARDEQRQAAWRKMVSESDAPESFPKEPPEGWVVPAESKPARPNFLRVIPASEGPADA